MFHGAEGEARDFSLTGCQVAVLSEKHLPADSDF